MQLGNDYISNLINHRTFRFPCEGWHSAAVINFRYRVIADRGGAVTVSTNKIGPKLREIRNDFSLCNILHHCPCSANGGIGGNEQWATSSSHTWEAWHKCHMFCKYIAHSNKSRPGLTLDSSFWKQRMFRYERKIKKRAKTCRCKGKINHIFP